MMVPEAWQNHTGMPPAVRAFYEYTSTLIEPWDGPAALTFTDGTLVGAVLDRNGLRPGRYWVTDDGLVVLASETGVLDLPPEKVVRKGRLQPGRMFLVDTQAGRIVPDEEVKRSLADAHPYQQWLDAGLVHLEDLPDRDHVDHSRLSVVRRQQTFGYTEEENRILLAPMAATGAEPIGSMGTDTPWPSSPPGPGCSSTTSPRLFAQVTNPPLDAIREEAGHRPGRRHRPGAEPARRHPRPRPQGRRPLPHDGQRPGSPRSSTSAGPAAATASPPPPSPGCTGSPAAGPPCRSGWRRSSPRSTPPSTPG